MASWIIVFSELWELEDRIHITYHKQLEVRQTVEFLSRVPSIVSERKKKIQMRLLSNLNFLQTAILKWDEFSSGDLLLLPLIIHEIT